MKLVLDYINFLEDLRNLSLIEWNFRSLLEEKLISLLQQQKIYWKQRGALKWVTLGDANTKFFRANATVKYRRNLITQLTNEGRIYLIMKIRQPSFGIPLKKGLAPAILQGLHLIFHLC